LNRLLSNRDERFPEIHEVRSVPLIWRKLFLANVFVIGTRDFQDNRRKSSVPMPRHRASRVAMGRNHEGMDGGASGPKPPTNSQGSLEIM